MKEMKDSGVEWIGEIPVNWELSKIGSVYEERNTKVSDKDYAALSVTKQGIVPQLENAAKTDNGDNRKLIKINDFVINSRSDRRGSCGISEYDGSCSLINTVLKPRRNMCNAYYSFVFRSELFADEFYRWGNGIVDDLWSTKWSSMKNIYIPFPTLEIQHRIADYLDNKCSKIDAIIEREQAAIEKLKEYKLSIITEVVTKGLNPGVKMKDSGLEWIEKIPDSWLTKKVKFLFENYKGLPITKDNLTNEGLPVISYGQIHSKANTGVSVSDDLIRHVDYSFQSLYPKSQVFEDDFIFADTSEDYDGCGNCVYKRDDTILFAGYHSIILHSKEKKDNRYLAYLFKTNGWRKQLREVASGVKLLSITKNMLINAMVILPPLNEQITISDYLDTKTAIIDAIIEHKNSAIEKFIEYKKSLIYEVVTGKKEV